MAVAICRSCPVRQQCLAEALDLEVEAVHVYGIRGGKTAGERRALQR